MIVEYVKGSILDAPQHYIAHGVNCMNKMGSGVARVLFEEYPEVKTDYHEFVSRSEQMWINGQEDLLGTIQPVTSNDKIIFNCFTQNNYGYDGNLYLDYRALAECFKHLNDYGEVTELAIPKIGCGLAGGHWEAVEQIINLVTPDVNIYVYELENK